MKQNLNLSFASKYQNSDQTTTQINITKRPQETADATTWQFFSDNQFKQKKWLAHAKSVKVLHYFIRKLPLKNCISVYFILKYG